MTITNLLTIGFGTTVLMWTVGYFCRLFGQAVSAPLLFALLLLVQLAGGVAAGHWTGRAALGAGAGLLSGVLNLLIVGSLIGGDTPNAIRSGALLWVPGTLVLGTLLGAGGALLGRALRSGPPPATALLPIPGGLASVAAVATFVLLAAGGLVTGFDEGLAVVDWPNTEGYNMFLYPLARMTGGVYLEHSHRLLGSLVGLTTLVLAFHVQFSDGRGRAKLLAWTALVLVVVQGLLGGLRVTGRLTLSTDPQDTNPSVLLAIVHGVLGQLVFTVLVALAVYRTRVWQTAGPPAPAPSASTDRTFAIALVVLLIMQLVLGALVRHFTWALHINRYGLAVDAARLTAIGKWALHVHITIAVVVVLAATTVGVRTWGLYHHRPLLARLGSRLLLLIAIQLALGIAALVVTGDDAVSRRPSALDVAITTAHQVAGAALLAWAVMLVMWSYRLLDPNAAEPAVAAAPALAGSAAQNRLPA